MSSPFHAVARGLRIAHIGFLFTCWAAITATGIGWPLSTTFYGNRPLHSTLIVCFWLAVAAAVAGVVVGIVGRIRCLAAPDEYTAIRGRVIAAVVLEASGWLSSFVGVGIFFAIGYRLLPLEPWVPSVGLIFSAVLLLCGRILFLRFLHVLARVVEDATTARRARWSLVLFLADWGIGLVGVGVAVVGSVFNSYDLSIPVTTILWIAAGASGLAGLFLYDRVLGGLVNSVRAFADSLQSDDEAVRDVTDDAIVTS